MILRNNIFSENQRHNYQKIQNRSTLRKLMFNKSSLFQLRQLSELHFFEAKIKMQL